MKTVITNQGISSVLEANNNGPLIKVTKVRIGSAIITPTSDMTDVTSFVWEGDSSYIQYLVVDNDTCLFNVVLDESIGNFDIGNIGLFLEDGTMFTISSLIQVEPKYLNSGSQVGNRRNYEVYLTLNNATSLIDVSMLSYYYSNLPTVLTEAGLPQFVDAAFNCYVVKYHTGLKTACLAIIYNNEWRYIPVESNELITKFEMENFDSAAVVGKPVYFDSSTSLFKLAGSNGYLGFRDSNNNIISNGVFSSNTLNLIAGSNYYIDENNQGSLTTTVGKYYVGKAISTNTIILNSFDNSIGYVDTATSQTIISGTKTFGDNSRLTLQDNAALNVNLVNTSFDWTAASSARTALSEMHTKDANDVMCSSIHTYAGSSNERVTTLQVNKPDGTPGAYVEAYYNTALGVGYGVAPTPPAGAYGDEIVTAAWVKGASAIPKLNWNAATAIPIPWTVNNYGIVIINFTSTNELIDFQCNGTAFARNAGTTYGTRGTGNIIVKPGDYISLIGNNPQIEQASFIPFA